MIRPQVSHAQRSGVFRRETVTAYGYARRFITLCRSRGDWRNARRRPCGDMLRARFFLRVRPAWLRRAPAAHRHLTATAAVSAERNNDAASRHGAFHAHARVPRPRRRFHAEDASPENWREYQYCNDASASIL